MTDLEVDYNRKENQMTEAEPEPKPKQKSMFPDRKIEQLHGLAEKYVDVRDERMGLTEKEVELKEGLLALMKKNKKQVYKYDGLEIRVVHSDESVKVRISKKDE